MGRTIGIYTAPAMVERAKKNAAAIENIEFHLATIDRRPYASADCIIDLAADKNTVFRESASVL